MHKIGIFYGSSTGTCEGLAAQLAGELGVADNDVHSANKLTEELVNTYDVAGSGHLDLGQRRRAGRLV